MTPEPLIRTEQRGRVLLAVIDMPGRTMNVFSDGLMDALEALIDRVEADHGIDALVLTSGKSAFIAGADLEMVRGYAAMGRTESRAELHATCGRLGRLFVRLEALAKPTVAALNGLALGGGLEVAMDQGDKGDHAPDSRYGQPNQSRQQIPRGKLTLARKNMGR